jgi:uncharacterized protein (TIGR03083 family)
MIRPQPILVGARFVPLRVQLLDLLDGLEPRDWERPTAAPGWTVKDVAAHLLGGDVGLLSRERDGYRPGASPGSYPALVDLVNRLNAEWVTAARRMSPRVLCDLLTVTGPAIEAHFSSLDVHAVGAPVSWAGPGASPVWFDIAREFTERWHHQQQIRDASGRPPLYDPYFFAPVLDTFVRALPHTFREAAAPPGTIIRVEIAGAAGGVWFLHRRAADWELALDAVDRPTSDVLLPEDIAWRLFTKGVSAQEARARAAIRGDADAVSPLFTATAIIG